MIFNKVMTTILVLLLCFACSKNNTQKLSNDRSSYKSSQALMSCQQIKLPADVDFEGEFLYHFFRCFSDRTEEGGESMGTILDILDAFEVSGMKNMTELFRYSDQMRNGKKDYPLIRSWVTFVERGVVEDDKKIDEKNYRDRFGTLQELLLDFNPSFLANLVLEGQKEKKLEEMLGLTKVLFDHVDHDIFLSYFRSFLEKKENRKDIIDFNDQVINHENLWDELTKLATFESSYKLKDQHQKNCLESFLVTYSQTDTTVKCPLEYSGTADGQERIDLFVKKLGNQEKNQLYNNLGKLILNLVDTMPDERLSKMLRFKDGISNALLEQKNPLINLTAILNLINTTPAKDMEHLVLAIQALIEDPNIPALFFANTKLGSSRLEEKIKNWMLKGGTVPGCDGLVLSGVNEYLNQEGFYQKVSAYLKPNKLCAYNLSPMISYVVATLNRFNNCHVALNQEFCISKQAMEKLGTTLNEIPFDNFLKTAPLDEGILKNLLLQSLGEVKHELIIEPYFLRFNHMAFGRVTNQLIDQLIKLVDQTSGLTPDRIASLDISINDDKKYNRILVSDFLEKILTWKIEKLKNLSHEFDGLFKRGNDHKLYRVLNGLYENSPLVQFIGSQLRYENITTETGGDHPGEAYRLREILFRAMGDLNLFHNNHLEFNDNEIDFKFIGDKNRSMTFDEDGIFKFTRQRPLLNKDVFSGNMLRLDALFKNGELMGKDVNINHADDLNAWIENDLYEKLQDSAFWQQHLSEFHFQSSLRDDLKYFSITPYSRDQFLKVVLFNSMNYLVVPSFLPASDPSFFYISKDKNIKKQLLNAPVDGNLNWTTFNFYYPDILITGEDKNRIPFSQIRKKINDLFMLEDYMNMTRNNAFQFKINEDSGIYEVQQLNERELEIFKYLQSLNLLTQNKNKDFVPIMSLRNGCYKNATEKSDCPITFHREGDDAAAFSQLKKHLSDIYLLALCPYLNQDQLGMDIKIDLDDKNDREFCEDLSKNYFTRFEDFSSQDVYPSSMRKIIIGDILSMGGGNQLKPGMNDLINHIRYAKNVKRNYSPEVFFHLWQGSAVSLPAPMSAHTFKFTSDHKGFNSVKTGVLNTYLFYVENMINQFSSSRTYENALGRYGANVRADQNPEKGELYDFIYDVIINTHTKYKEKGTVSDWLLEMFHEINRDEKNLEVIVRLTAGGPDNQTYSVFKNLLGLFIKRISEIMQADPVYGKFSWKQPGNKVLMQMLKQEIWWMLTDITTPYTFNESKSFLKTMMDIFLSEPYDPVVTRSLIRNLSGFLNDHMTSIHSINNKGYFNGEIIEDHLIDSLKVNNNEQVVTSFNRVIEQINQQHEDFDGNNAPELKKHFSALAFWAVEFLPKLMKNYQLVVEGNNQLKLQPEFLKNLLNSCISPFKNDPSLEKGLALSGLLQDKNLGTYESVIQPLLFPSENILYHKMFLKFIESAGKVRAEIYLSSLLVIDQLLKGAKVLLNFITDKINWEKDTSEDAIKAFESINRISDYENGIWKAQEEVLTNWFGKGIMYRQTPLME